MKPPAGDPHKGKRASCTHLCTPRPEQSHRLTQGVAYEARKAPGGAYQHNIFHQAEHLYCMLSMAMLRREQPDVLLWPYRSLAWSRALATLVLPQTIWEETCCGPANVAASWWKGERRVCPCWQKVCPQRYHEFWPGPNGSAAHAQLRAVVRQRCSLPFKSVRPEARVVRLLERPAEHGRQFENRADLIAALRRAAHGATLDFAVAKAPGGALPSPAMLNATFRGRAKGAGRLSRQSDGYGMTKAGDAALRVHEIDGAAALLCEQVRWFAGAKVVILAHGSAATNAIFADPGTAVIDVTPYGHQPSASAPEEYYAALLKGTDISYAVQDTSEKPLTPLQNKAVKAFGRVKSLMSSAANCRREWSCTQAFRDHCCMRLSSDDFNALEDKVARALYGQLRNAY